MSWHLCLGSVLSLEHFHYVSVSSRLVSTKSEMSWLVSCLDTSILANVSVSEKNVSTPSLLTAGAETYDESRRVVE